MPECRIGSEAESTPVFSLKASLLGSLKTDTAAADIPERLTRNHQFPSDQVQVNVTTWKEGVSTWFSLVLFQW